MALISKFNRYQPITTTGLEISLELSGTYNWLKTFQIALCVGHQSNFDEAVKEAIRGLCSLR